MLDSLCIQFNGRIIVGFAGSALWIVAIVLSVLASVSPTTY